MASDFGTTITSYVINGMTGLIIGAIVIFVLVALVVFSIIMYKRKKWNLKVTLKLTRSDGLVFLTEWAKGYWDAQNGWIVIKRKGYRKIKTRPIDPKKWVKGRDHVTIIQVGPEDYIVADEQSYEILIDSETQQQIPVMRVIADVGKRKTWVTYTERTAKKTFTIGGWMEEHWRAVEIAIILISMFLGFAIIWMRLPSMCPGVG